MLDREEYVEQAYLFAALRERQHQGLSTQELLAALGQEILSTTRLPLALEYLATELRHSGQMSPAMARLEHYFHPFQSYVISEAEREGGRFDFRIALEILQREAEYRANKATPQGIFLFQFECLCRNRLGYDRGLEAVSRDPIFDADWREWVLTVRRQAGLVDFSELLYVRSEHYHQMRQRQGLDLTGPEKPLLFGEKEGKIALAHRRKDPLWLFAALERQLGYPVVPRPQPIDQQKQVLPDLLRRVDRLEGRLKLLEEESRGGVDLSRFMPRPDSTEPPDGP